MSEPETTVQRWRVSYRYTNPHGAGPFRGRDVLDYRPAKGDIIPAMFGKAEVLTVSRAKQPARGNV